MQVLSKSQKRKLKDISDGISAALRTEILRDIGSSRLQDKALLLIS